MPVVYSHSPQIISDFLQRRQQENEANQQNARLQKGQDQQQQDRFRAFLVGFTKADPTTQQRMLQVIHDRPEMFPKEFQQLKPFDPSQAEQNQASMDKTFTTLPQSVQQSASYQHTTGAAMPATQVLQQSAQDVYANAPQFDPQMQGRQQVLDKTALDAQQKRQAADAAAKLQQQAPLVSAQAATQRATAGKITSEKTGLDITNQMMSGMAGPSGGAPVAGGSPAPQGQTSAIAQSLADRKYDPKLLRNLIGKNPGLANALELQVRQIDPNFSMADYEANVATKKAYASGPQAQNVTSLNTAIRHLNSLYDDSGKMKNSRFPTYNVAANFLAQEAGNEGVQRAASAVSKDADAVANELNKAFRGSSQLSERDTASWRQGIGPNATPAQIQGAVSAAIKLLAGRNAELAMGYERGVGRPMERDFLGSGARNILKRFGKIGIQGTDELLGGQGAQTPAAPSNPDPLGILQ